MKIEQRKWSKESGWISLTDNNLKNLAQLVFLFGSTELLKNSNYLKEVKDFYPKARIVGCSTAGEIIESQVLDDSVAVTAVYFENTKLRFAKTKLEHMEDSKKAGVELAQALEKDGLRHVFVLSDGLHVNGSALAEGLAENLSDNVVVTGGLAADQARFQETRVVFDDVSESNLIVVIAFYGDSLKVGYGSKGGWDSFGVDRRVTKSKGNIVYELDGQPPLELYKRYLGAQAQGLPATGLLFPLSMRLQERDTVLVRTVLAVNDKDGSMTFAGDIPEGALVRLMKANFERLINGATEAAEISAKVEDSSSRPALALLISCVGRRLVLKQRVEEEVETVQQILGGNAVLTGFYSYGEICPAAFGQKRCELHNQTMTITTFFEEKAGV